MSKVKYVYTFGDGKAEGRADMKNLLGGKGANLCEMNLLGVPVPAGFIVTTEVCTIYNQKGKDATVNLIKDEVETAISQVEIIMKAKFNAAGDGFPLLLSVRSGARVSMPGMMNTVLNLGLNDKTVKILAEKSNNERFAYDSYRRFIQMYGDVVMGVQAEKGHHDPFEVEIDKLKKEKGYKLDTEFTGNDL
ncbi:MAG TPA: PEP/pyruvate-binding domain-containing protein, partial [Salinivirgaceae bacterium]|nr:PEP/pyruvate-binding domain-containing protein [Salinivirgaceae bacterium]